MRLSWRFALASLALATVLVGADALLTQWSLRREAALEATRHRSAREAETLLRLENQALRQVEQLRRLHTDAEFSRLANQLAKASEAPEAALRLAERYGFDQLLLLAADGEIVWSLLHAESYGVVHPAASFLSSCLESAPVLYDDWTSAGPQRCLGAVEHLRGLPVATLLVASSRLDTEQLAAWAANLQLRELHWSEADGLATPGGFQLQKAWRLAVTVDPSAASRALWAHGRKVLAFQLALLVLAPLLGMWLGQRLARPVQRLGVAIEALRAGRVAPEIPPVGTPELDRLAQVFLRLVQERDAAQEQRLAAERRGAWREIAQRVAHEIKNALSPLTLAVDNVETALDRPDETARTVTVRSLQTAREQLASLDRLVSEFRALAQIPAPRFAPLDPAALCRSARDAVLTAGFVETVQIEAAPPLHDVYGDVEQLRRALVNLLRNAAEAAPGREIELAHGEGPGDSHWWCAVRDQGPGLSLELQQQLGRAVLSQKPGGSGLGLAIVQQTARGHGGRLSYRPRRPHGCELRLELPKQPLEPGAQLPPEEGE